MIRKFFVRTVQFNERAAEVRADQSHSLLAIVIPEGVCLCDRRTKSQHIITWDQLTLIRNEVVKSTNSV